MQLVVVPAARVSIDARIGEARASQIALEPGRHVVELSQLDFVPLRRTLTFLPGQTQRLVVDLAEEAVPSKRRHARVRQLTSSPGRIVIERLARCSAPPATPRTPTLPKPASPAGERCTR